MRATWKPHEKHGRLTKRADLPDSVFAYPADRAEPLTDASHVRNARATTASWRSRTSRKPPSTTAWI